MEDSLLPIVLKMSGYTTPCKGHRGQHQGQSGGRGSDRKAWVKAFIVVSWEGMGGCGEQGEQA